MMGRKVMCGASGGAGVATIGAVGTSMVLSNSDLTVTLDVNSDVIWRCTRSEVGKDTGKFYFEYTIDAISNLTSVITVGIIDGDNTLQSWSGATADGFVYFDTGSKGVNGSVTNYGASFTAGDIIGVAVDLDANKIWFSKNGVFQAGGDPGAGTGEAGSIAAITFYPSISLYDRIDSISIGPCTVTFESTAASLTYSAPSGFTGGWPA